MRQKSYFRVFMAMLILGGIAAAAPSTVHARKGVRLRVEIDDARSGEPRLQLNVPLNSLEEISDILGEELDLDLGKAMEAAEGIDLREIYRAFRYEDLSDLLEIQDEDGESVRVWKDTEAFRVEVRDSWRAEPKVRIRLPLSVLDALLLSGDQLDLRAAVQELRALAPLTLVEADEEDERIRIWLE
jgi:hypothetical protein